MAPVRGRPRRRRRRARGRRALCVKILGMGRWASYAIRTTAISYLSRTLCVLHLRIMSFCFFHIVLSWKPRRRQSATNEVWLFLWSIRYTVYTRGCVVLAAVRGKGYVRARARGKTIRRDYCRAYHSSSYEAAPKIKIPICHYLMTPQPLTDAHRIENVYTLSIKYLVPGTQVFRKHKICRGSNAMLVDSFVFAWTDSI